MCLRRCAYAKLLTLFEFYRDCMEHCVSLNIFIRALPSIELPGTSRAAFSDPHENRATRALEYRNINDSFMGLTGGSCAQGCVWGAGLHDATVPGGDAVPLLSHHSLRAVPAGLRAPRGVQFGHVFWPARPALAGAAAARDCADARLHGGDPER